MPRARAAAEKPSLSTTFTKVVMLVIRSMQSPDLHRADMFRNFHHIKLLLITFTHV
jgi:hypothetical protein